MAIVTQQQAPSTLPHLPKGMAMQHTAINDNPLPMPGKHLQETSDEARWKDDNEPNTMEAPSAEGQHASRRGTTSPSPRSTSPPSESGSSGLDVEEQRRGAPGATAGPAAAAAAVGGGTTQQQLQPPTAAVQRESKTLVEPDPPPLFLAQPGRSFSISRRESKIQRQVYRMDTGINPVNILTDRLEAWRQSIKSLVALFKYIRGIERKSAVGYCNSTKILANPFRESSGQFMESGGIREVWNAFRNYAMEQSVTHQEYVNYLDRSVLPSLRNIKYDIKTLIKAITRDKGLRSSVLYEGRRRVGNLISELDKIIQLDLQMPETAYKRHDPLLLNCAVFKAFRDLHNSENNIHSNVLNLQREVGMFERNLIENCRVVCQKFQDFRLNSKMESHSALGQITTTFKDIKPDSEWNEFVRRNQGNLVSENAAYKTDQDIHYPNQQHDLVQPVKVGLLERKAGMMRNWTEGLYVLTPAGFLHGYKSAAHFDADPMAPDVSIFVPHTNINHARKSDSSYQDSLFEIRGKNTQSSIGREKDFCFRARDAADLQDWFGKLVQMSDRFRPVPLLKDFDRDRALPSRPNDDNEDVQQGPGQEQQQQQPPQQEEAEELQQQQQQQTLQQR